MLYRSFSTTPRMMKNIAYMLGLLGSSPTCLPLQKGLREPLLCWDCEQKLSAHEKYNREILYGGVEITGVRKSNRIIHRLELQTCTRLLSVDFVADEHRRPSILEGS
jgi:hypothetical protein